MGTQTDSLALYTTEGLINMKTQILFLLITFHLSIGATCQDSFTVNVELIAESPIEELPKNLNFLPITLSYDSIKAAYSVKNVTPGIYRLRVGIINYHRIDTPIVVGKGVSNKHLIELIKIPNEYSFSNDLHNEKLRLYVKTSGPTVFEGSQASKKMKSLFNVSIVSSYSGFNDNTDYDLRYSKQVIAYLDDKFGSKWRKELLKYELTPWE